MKTRIPQRRTSENSVKNFVQSYRKKMNYNEKDENAVGIIGTDNWQGKDPNEVTSKQANIISIIEDYYKDYTKEECLEATNGKYSRVIFEGFDSQDAYEFIGDFLDICPAIVHIGGGI